MERARSFASNLFLGAVALHLLWDHFTTVQNPVLKLAGWALSQAALLCASIALHELAHYAVARLCGMKVWEVQIGGGDWWEWDARGTHWSVGFSGLTGLIRLAPKSQPARPLIAVFAAGAAMNAALLALFAQLASKGLFTGREALLQVFAYPAVFNAILVFYNLRPGGEGGFDNDGRQIQKVLDRTHPLLAGRTLDQENQTWRALIARGEAPHALRELSRVLKKKLGTRTARRDCMDGYVTLAAMLGDPEFMEEARAYAREHFDERPRVPTVKASYGGMLVEHGELERGESLLREAYEEDELPFDRGIIAAYLGRARELAGDAAQAALWYERSRQADPSGLLLERFTRKEKGQTL